MTRSRDVRRSWGHLQAILWGIIILGLVSIRPVQEALDARLDFAPQAPATLLVRSAKGVRPLCFGMNGLLGDIYWTRAVQYFGRATLVGKPMPELGSLLSVATDLDPHLLVAYRFGAIFLAEKSSGGGAGDPKAALALLQKGIVANPKYWRLWQDLGFIYYWDLRDYAAAARAFHQGSLQPGAMVWMKAMAASVAARGGELKTSKILWEQILRDSDDPDIRSSARQHIQAVDAAIEIRTLDGLLEQYKRRVGRAANAYSDLIAAGMLRRYPLDPTGAPLVITKSGKAGLSDHSKINLLLATMGK